MRRLTCPKCRAVLDDEHEFTVIESAKTSTTSLITGYGPYGLTVVTLDSQTDHIYKDREIQCMSCGHQWTSQREIDWYTR